MSSRNTTYSDDDIYSLSGDNNNLTITVSGLLTTLYINISLFVLILILFEFNKKYKQIYLKRYQQRFIDTDRVPQKPPDCIFGWLICLWDFSELDVLRMVGLDAYMLLRYHVVCYKLALFYTFWGLLVLLPIYCTVDGNVSLSSSWDKYTISNVMTGGVSYRYRLWAAAIFGYIFSAYFCQLLYAEYSNFSIRRLQYLVQVDPNSSADPDTPPQKYFTVMVERIPGHLRSSEALFQFFDKIFPGQVFHVEIALDLTQLDNLSSQRKSVRYNLEKAVAEYEATNIRPKVYIQTKEFTLFMDGTTGIAAESDDISAYLEKLVAPEEYGYELLDSIKYYANRLMELNNKFDELQTIKNKYARNADELLQQKLKNKYDTRIAAAIESMTKTLLGSDNSTKSNGMPKIEKVLDNMLFGPPVLKLKNVARMEMEKIDTVIKRSSITEHAIQSQEGDMRIETPKTPPNAYLANQNTKICDDQVIDITHINSLQLSPGSWINKANASFPQINVGSTNEDVMQVMEKRTISENSDHIMNIHEDTVFSEWVISSKIDFRKEFEMGQRRASQTVAIPVIHAEKTNDNADIKCGSNDPTQFNVINPLHSELDENEIESNKKGEIKRKQTQKLHLQRGNNSNTAKLLSAANNSTMTKVTKSAWQQTKLAGLGAWKGLVEIERALEMVSLGAFTKYSTTAFVTFTSRVTENISHQMLLSHESMEINHAPNPKDIIWANVPIPKSQVKMRHFIANILLIFCSIFWSQLVTSINIFVRMLNLGTSGGDFLSVVIILIFLLILPQIFDFIARYYEGIKLESEVQNSIMTRYFYYQLVNIYVTIGTGGLDIWDQILLILRKPQTLVNILGRSIPSVSLYFCSLMLVKILIAIPLEMIRPWQLSTILLMGNCMDSRKTTKRELKSGAFYAWPMLYGWIYPQLMMVLMIMTVYACISPLLSPLCVVFFATAYMMYKYQLLYVYINEYQSGGFMWYAVFNRSLISLMFAILTLLGYLSLQLHETYFAGPFYFLLPLPACIWYFWYYCEQKFAKASMNLSFAFAKELDHRDDECRKNNREVPHDTFKKECFRQPSLIEQEVYPESYRAAYISATTGTRKASMSLNVYDTLDETDENIEVSRKYFDEYIMPLANEYVEASKISNASSKANVKKKKPTKVKAKSNNEREKKKKVNMIPLATDEYVVNDDDLEAAYSRRYK